MLLYRGVIEKNWDNIERTGVYHSCGIILIMISIDVAFCAEKKKTKIKEYKK